MQTWWAVVRKVDSAPGWIFQDEATAQDYAAGFSKQFGCDYVVVRVEAK